MWFNGLITVVDLGLAASDPALRAHRDAILWGALREDVWCIPLFGTVVPNPSLSHFERARHPGGYVPWLTAAARERAAACAQRALARHAGGDAAAAFVCLGRACHALVDMACPVHAQGRLHGADPYEWAVEAMAESLRSAPLPAVMPAADFAAITGALAASAQQVPAGRIRVAEARRHARVLIPLAGAHLAHFLSLYADRARGSRPIPERCALHDDALEMSRAAQRRWRGQLTRWAESHGGRRHYARLLDLVEARDQVAAMESRA